jgi:hypothetical protein
VPSVDLIDETFVVASPSLVSAAVHDPRRWRAWWPDLELSVFMDRAQSGIRWSVSGAFVGSNEIWLEPVGDGTLLHYFLRVDPKEGALTPRRAARVRRARALAWKRWVNALKDELEGGREPGTPASDSRT